MPSWAMDATSVPSRLKTRAAPEAAAALRARRRLDVHQPVVHTYVPVPPHRVVERGDRQPARAARTGPCAAGSAPAAPGRRRTRAGRGAGAGRRAADLGTGTTPTAGRDVRGGTEVDLPVDVPHVERRLLGPELRDGMVDRAEHVERRRHVLRCGDPGGHRVGVVDARLLLLEGGDHRQDRRAALQRVGPASREGPAVAEPLDRERDGFGDVTRAQEVAVQRVREPAVGHGAPRQPAGPVRAPARRTRDRSAAAGRRR